MIQASENRVYLAKTYGQSAESFKAEAAQAKYNFAGKEQHLKFDGQVDRVVLDSLKGSKGLITGAKDLSAAVDSVESQKATMDSGKPVQLKFGSGKAWTGEKQKAHHSAKNEFDYVYTSPDGHQQAIFTDDGRAKLKTKGEGISHEVIGKVYNNSDKDDLVFYISESISVAKAKGAKGAKKPSGGAKPTKPAPKKDLDNQVPF